MSIIFESSKQAIASRSGGYAGTDTPKLPYRPLQRPREPYNCHSHSRKQPKRATPYCSAAFQAPSLS
eukprot:1157777-Amphidinium_carterae.1